MDEIKKQVLQLLPNKEKVLHFVWDSLEGPLGPELNEFLISKIEHYGFWKERIRSNGTLAYKGWIYNQRKQGHWLYLFKNGGIRKDVFYRNNKYHGICKLYEVDGSYEVRECYKGRLNGQCLRYNSEGVLYQRVLYEMNDCKEFEGPVELGLYKNSFEL